MLKAYFTILRQALVDPREAATALLSYGVSQAALWPMFWLISILSVLFAHLTGVPVDDAGREVQSPVTSFVVSIGTGITSIFAVWKIGELMGGKGSFNETLLLTIFLQSIVLCGQVLSLVVAGVFPPFEPALFYALIVLVIWVNVNFIATLHGFSSLWRSLGLLIVSTIPVIIVFMIILSFVGLPIIETP